MKKTSIKDIAKMVNVSTTTVSLVLTGKNKNGRVSKELSEKIIKVAREMNYQPNRLAKSLQSGCSRTIGLLVADISNPFFGTLTFHVQEEMEKADYTVIIMNTNESDVQMGRMIDLLRSRQVDGFIIVPAEYGEDYIARLVEEHVPLVLIDRYYPSQKVDSVLINNFQAANEATRYLIDIHCKKIALLIYENTQPHMVERERGYVRALKEAGLYDESLVKKVRYKYMDEDIIGAITWLYQQRKDLDGILFATNTIAMTGIKQLLNVGLRIGEDIHVTCFDKSDAFDFMPVFIPYIHQPIAEMGRLASQLLIQRIEGERNDDPFIYELPAELVRTPL